MPTIILNLGEELAARLREVAAAQGMESEEWARQIIEEQLKTSGFDPEFEATLSAVLEENTELYRRLA